MIQTQWAKKGCNCASSTIIMGRRRRSWNGANEAAKPRQGGGAKHAEAATSVNRPQKSQNHLAQVLLCQRVATSARGRCPLPPDAFLQAALEDIDTVAELAGWSERLAKGGQGRGICKEYLKRGGRWWGRWTEVECACPGELRGVW
jgi:hypothetical protein